MININHPLTIGQYYNLPRLMFSPAVSTEVRACHTEYPSGGVLGFVSHHDCQGCITWFNRIFNQWAMFLHGDMMVIYCSCKWLHNAVFNCITTKYQIYPTFVLDLSLKMTIRWWNNTDITSDIELYLYPHPNILKQRRGKTANMFLFLF